MYVLDSSVFIQAGRSYYAFDLAPGFWNALIQHAQAGKVRSIDRVEEEINRGNDELKKWAQQHFHPYFESTKQGIVIDAYTEVIEWAHHQTQFTAEAKDEFNHNADAWVIAYAKAKKGTVVSQEVYNPAVRRRIPIPNVCKALGVKCIDTFQMLRDLGVKL
ncbi:MAG: DUF4411 family protein [Sandaracinaceae bacterium]|nr:DUF4411 family protein [Sandaracinaceae bacterium]MDW8245144.1 DUF4411 family protein [Sandaracinaceae bacterium]